MKRTRVRAGVLAVVGAVLASCGSSGPGGVSNGENASSGTPPPVFTESEAARARIDELRARFSIARGEATGFERGDAGGLRATVPAAASQGLSRRARVELPLRADGESRIEDASSGVSVRFRLVDAKPAAAAVAGGHVLYAGALEGADVVHRVSAEGTEDYVVFERPPVREELRYALDVTGARGLRLVSNTLEFLDERGSPALRVAPPYVVDAKGMRHVAKLAIRGCAYDDSAAAPWDRPVTVPGAETCQVHVTWRGVAYPAMVDPTWGATGSLSSGHVEHTASVLGSGRVLIIGGEGSGAAELFDPAAAGGVGAFAATGSMMGTRGRHTASVLGSGKVLAAGGIGTVSGKSAEIYDPATGLFTPTSSMATERQYHVASVLASGKVLMAGGNDGSAEVFDPAANGGAGAFVATGALSAARMGATASRLASGKVVIAGGSNGPSLATAEVFDPAANGGVGGFTATGPMATARYRHTASVLVSGKVLIAGPDATAEVFDPAANGGSGAFAPTGSMAAARYIHAAAVLPSGRVLLTGGLNLASAELFDPAANGGIGAFASTNSMSTANFIHTASVLASGKVLVAGGQASMHAELFGGIVGEACVSGYCVTGTCVDGFCCDTACASGCDRCDLPNKEGTCTVVLSGNPGANAACVAPFVCDGVSASCPTTCVSDTACALTHYCAPNGTCQARKAQAAACNTQANCKVTGCRECSSGNCVDGLCCDTACGGSCQACAASLKQSNAGDGTCGAIKDGTDPRSECATGALCGPDGTCNGAGGCRLFSTAGVSCGSGVCQGTVARGELCNGAGTCAANAAGVECSPFLCANGGCTTTCATSSDCAAEGWCNAGKCEKRRGNGKACTTKEQCSTGVCADGFCCNTPCTGQCEACDIAAAEGTCAPVSGAPHGRAACAQGSKDKPCSASLCDGTERNACKGFVGPSVTCGTAACSAGAATAAGKCDGKGTCSSPATVPCAPYACGPTACNASCGQDADCAAVNTCDVTTSKCISSATCDGEHTTTGATGTTQDCTPYRCETNGSCRSQCGSASDCVAPFLCDTSFQCVPPELDPGSEDGCAVAAPGRASAELGWLSVAVAFVAACGRRRRKQANAGERR